MSTVNSDSLLRRIQMQHRLSPTIVLNYDPPSRDLRVWFWPVTQMGRRVSPSDLLDYRLDHDFKAPCCLCASNARGISFTESAIYIALSGPYEEEYVAGCAADHCGYLINLERLYPMRGLLLRKYPLELRNTAPVPYMPMHTENSVSSSSGSSQAGRTVGGLFASIATYARPVRLPDSALDRLLRLDSQTRPGLSEAEFNRLFAKCDCGLLMTRRVFRNHVCAIVQNPSAVIDLTEDDHGSDDTPRIIIDLTADSDDDSDNFQQ